MALYALVGCYFYIELFTVREDCEGTVSVNIYKYILYSETDHIATIQIHRPERSNSLHADAMLELQHAVENTIQNDVIQAIILTASGNRSFVSGGDLKEFHQTLRTEEEVYNQWGVMRSVLTRISQSPKPFIAAINGATRGGGAEIAIACHFRIASVTSSIGFVQIALGISPGWGGGTLLYKKFGYQTALRLLLLGEIIPANEALQVGLFDKLANEEELIFESKKFAQRLIQRDSKAVQEILAFLHKVPQYSLEEAFHEESSMCARLWNSNAHSEAVRAFLSKNSSGFGEK